MKKIIICFMIGLVLPLGTVVAVDQAEITQLISQLGSDNYQKRLEASKKLQEIGQPARSQLETAISSTDPEIRMRAKEILKDIKLGIRPSWPEKMVKKVRGFSKLKTDDRKKLIAEIVEISEREAMPFLFTLLEKNSGDESGLALQVLLSFKEKKTLWNQTIKVFSENVPSNKYQAELYAKAGIGTGDFEVIRKSLKSSHIPRHIKNEIVKNQVAVLDEMLNKENYTKAAKRAEELSESLPDNAKILYIQADALSRLQRDDQAREIEEKALSLNPETEGPHYTAGEYLTNAGKMSLAVKEWEKILEIPPVDGVYDINAYLRLSDIYAKNKMYKKALEFLEKGVKKYRIAKEKHGSGMGMLGEDKLDQKIAYLKKKAREEGNAGIVVSDKPPKKKNYVKFNLNLSEKKGKYDEMVKELKNVQGSMAFTAQPYGIGLLKKKIVKMKYDSEKDEFAVTLNNSPCAKPQKLGIKDKADSAKIAVFELDTCNIYEITPETEKVELLKSYDKEYKLKILKGGLISNWKDTVIKCNGKEYSWEELEIGLPFDYLPEKMNIEITGTTPSGKNEEVKFSVDSGKMN
jgi:tetratricopeptide (TPR) repeat protein